MTIQPGQTLLYYRIVDKVGEGGMGEVWRAVDTTLDREVAIKTLPPEFGSDTERLARFEREARTLASLSHPNRFPSRRPSAAPRRSRKPWRVRTNKESCTAI